MTEELDAPVHAAARSRRGRSRARQMVGGRDCPGPPRRRGGVPAHASRQRRTSTQIPRAAPVRASVGGFLPSGTPSSSTSTTVSRSSTGQRRWQRSARPSGLSGDGRAGFVVVLKRAERVDEDADGP